jgi:GNAT superfamily N-acetyltransferase
MAESVNSSSSGKQVMSASEAEMVTVRYIQMESPQEIPMEAPCGGLMVDCVLNPDADFYRLLYDTVGEDYNWRSRRKLSREALEAIIRDPGNLLIVLRVDGKPAGFAELDRRKTDEIEIVQFGLFPQMTGRGLGKWFLQSVLRRAWAFSPRRIWLHTCTLDHPAALPNYLKAGFEVYRTEVTPKYV